MSEPAKAQLVDQDGKFWDFPAANVAAAKAKGFRDPTAAELKEQELQKKYGEGVLPAVGAAASGAASTLSFGASDALLARTPLAEANREVVARNPGSHVAGSLAALAIPFGAELAAAKAAKAGVEVGTAAKVAQAAGEGVSLVGKAAQGVGKGAGALAEAVGLGRAAPVVAGAAQGAAEGLAFQAGANLGAAARRDADFDAETLLAHSGESAFLGLGIGAAIPLAGKVARWSADKAIAGIERGVQGLRELGFGAADAAVGAVEAGARAGIKNADRIGETVAGAVNRTGQAIEDAALPRIREGLTAQTGRPDIINEVFASTPEAAALRRELGPKTLTGTREVQAEEVGKHLNEIWKASLDSAPMFDDLALGVKRDMQSLELATSPLQKRAQAELVRNIIDEANATIEQLGKFNGTAKTYFEDALRDFGRTALTKPSAESIYRGLDELKVATDRIAKFGQGAALGDTGAAFAAEEARRFRTFAKQKLEDSAIWGNAGVVQQEANAALSRYYKAMEQFEAQFAGKAAKGTRPRVLEGSKVTKWMREITGPGGAVKNAVVDDLVDAQRELIALTDRLSKRAQQQARETLGSATASEAARAQAAAIEAAPEAVAAPIARGTELTENLANAKATAAKEIDRAEVLQQTQNAILSRQGAGVNPLPVELAQRVGAGALVGGAIGGVPGALVGGGITSALQKYGAITTNPKTAIEFLNTLDRMKSADKDRIAQWIKSILGEAEKRAPGAKAAIERGNEKAAARILATRKSAEAGVETLANKLEAATPGLMRRILPAVSYADVTNSKPEEWWARTQKSLSTAQADPQRLAARLSDETASLGETLPALAQAVTAQQLRVINYLAERMPKNPRPYVLGQREWTPTKGELKAFRDIVLVATKPDALLPLLTIGLATRAQVDAVRELWPKKFEDTRAQVTQAVMTAASEGKPVPYKARIRLGQLLGVPMDPSQEPGFSAWIQQGRARVQAAQDAREEGGAQPMNLNLNTQQLLPQSDRLANRN